MKRFAALILSMAMAVSSLPAMAMAEEAEVSDDITVFADAADVSTDVTFTNRYWDPDKKKVISENKTIHYSDYVVLKDLIQGTSFDGDVKTDAMYLLVTENITINGKLRIKSSHSGTDANVGLIVYDGVTLTCTEGIVCEQNNKLRIYGVSPEVYKQGKIVTTGNGGAGIGGESGISGYDAGFIEIYGCNITATGDYHCAGIGGGNNNAIGGCLSIFDGYITANGGEGAAGIGGGYSGKGGDIVIYGGVVRAKGGAHGAGIGGGDGQHGGNITIRGAERIEATGGEDGAGIGGGNFAAGGVITISGGNVIAKTSGDTADGAGIGGGYRGNGGTITISGGAIDAKSEDGAGIGGGSSADGGSIEITGGSVKAVSTGWSAAIGSGYNCSFGGTIVISGGSVDATTRMPGDSGYAHGAAIGAGYRGDFKGKISFTGGNTICTLVDDKGYKWEGVLCGPGTDGGNDPGAFKGEFVLGDVRVGISEETSSTYAAEAERNDYFKKVAYKLFIDKCGHLFDKSKGSYSTDPSHPGQHKKSCYWCTHTEYEDHSFAKSSWVWNGYDSATFTLTCECDVTKSATASGEEITSEVTKESTYVTHGIRVYTAAVTIDGKEYTSSKTEELPLRTDTYDIDYKDIDGSIKTATARPIIGDEGTLEAGWYAVTDNVTDDNRIKCNGDVNIILCDDTEFKVPSGIRAASGSSLTIWGQQSDSGILTADVKDVDNAAIGGEKNVESGLITINGGTVNATGKSFGAAIGGGDNAQGTVVINGGRINASGGDSAAIGGGLYSNGVVTINGGLVTATINGGSAAIGGGYRGKGTVTINGGVISAFSKSTVYTGFGIGNGWGGGGNGSVTLNYGDNGVSISTSGYRDANVTLAKPFTDGEKDYPAGAVSDIAALENTTLTPPALVAGYTVSLDGTIGVNYHMDLPSDIVGHTNTAYMEFSVGGSDPQQVYLKDAKKETIGGKSYYVFRCEVPAKDMTTYISAKLVDGNSVIPVNPFTVKEYADYLLDPANAHPDYEKSKDLVRALINYGAYSQEYFGVNPDSPANEGYEYSESEMNVTIPVEYKGYDKSFPDSMVTFAGSSLSLKSETTLSFYFKSSETLSFTCEDETKTVETVNSGVYQIARVRGITASELGRELRLDIKINGTPGSYIEYHPLTYCYKILNGGSDDVKLQNVCKAMYLYYKAAVDYMN